MSCLDEGLFDIIPKKPQVGDLWVDNGQGGELMIYTDDNGVDWKKVTPDKPNWIRSHYVFSTQENNIGIWSGVIDDENKPATWTLHEGDAVFRELDAKIITKEEYETMVAFEAIPVVEVERESISGILLKFPD